MIEISYSAISASLFLDKFQVGVKQDRIGGRGEAYTRFCWGNLRERDHFGDPGVDGRIILRWIFRK